MGAALVFCAVAGIYFLRAPEFSGLAAPGGSPAAPAAEAPPPLPTANALSFLRDSLRLTGTCETGCARIALEISEAGKLGRFGPRGVASMPTGLPSRWRSASAAAGEAAAPADAAETDAAQTGTSTAPARIRITPTIVVPLPRPNVSSGASPVPASSPNQPNEEAAPSPVAALMQPASLSSGGRRAPTTSGPAIGANDGVAVYDISAAAVYLPDGERLEAHSGLGNMADNPRYVDRRNTGPTPPGTYKLQLRPNLFFGVEALRMVPIDGKSRFGRDGFLTHTYLLRGRPGQSNGCVVFPDYARFLQAFKRGHVRRLVVVASLRGSPMQVASAGAGN